MRRTILTSMLLIGAALAVVFGGGTFSAFNDVETINGDAEAGVLGIRLTADDDTADDEDTTNDELDLVFDANDCAYDFFAPGDSCDIEVTANRGELSGSPFTNQIAADLKFQNFVVNSASQSAPDSVTGGTASVSCTGATGDGWVVTVGGFTDTDGANASAYMPAGADDTETFILTVALDVNAPNECQADTLTIALEVNADQDIDNPHNPADDKTALP